MRRKRIKRGAVFATVVGLGLTGLTVGSTFTAPIALAQSANQSGPYDPTRQCTGDNQGKGNAPCNGSVGKADDKNPNGQLPGGSDSNKGYECDGNKGVGDNGGNPAHTACQPGSNSTGQQPGNNPGSVGPNGEVLALTESAPLPGTPTPGAVEAETLTAAPAAQAVAATSPRELAFTGPGSLTYALAAVGSVMVLLGLLLVKATKEQAFA